MAGELNADIDPTGATERIVVLDVLRGFALLGILYMNIQAFAMPESAYFIPTLYGDLSGINLWAWFVGRVLFDQKFMTLFSILFGAGIVLQTARLDARGVSARGMYYRRTFWLLLFGLAHAYLLWAGDILTTYALCAALLFYLRKLAPWYLILMGALVLLIPPLLMFGSYKFAPPEVVQDLLTEFSPSNERIEKEVAAYRGGWLEQMAARVPSSLSVHSSGLLFYLLWRAGGLMLVGMALYKWGVLSARSSAKLYKGFMWIGFGAGIPLVAYGVFDNFSHGWDVLYARMGPGFLYNYVGSILVSLGYIGVVMRIVQLNLLRTLRVRLAAVGRMALSNYLLHTFIATVIFYGYGFGLYGSVSRWQLVLIVLVIWGMQLAVSPVWLRYFKFGPFEWLWRSLTYKQLQPMRVK